MPRKIPLLLALALLLSGCAGGGNSEERVTTTKPVPSSSSSVDLEAQSKELEAIANGKKSDMVIVPTLFLDLGKDKLPSEANASKDLIFVVTIRSLDAGVLSYENVNGASIKVNALSYGSIAYKFPKAGVYKLLFTTQAGKSDIIALVTAL